MLNVKQAVSYVLSLGILIGLSSAAVDVFGKTAGSSTTTIKVNFQPRGTYIPKGYFPDYGFTYSKQNGYYYGWNKNHEKQAIERIKNSDQRLDTLCRILKGGKWEIALPKGRYNVKVSVGDPSFKSTNTINIEGVNYWNKFALKRNKFSSKTKEITVDDGQLTIDQGEAWNNATRINYVEIVKAKEASTPSPEPTPEPTAVPAQTPASTPVPTPAH